MSDEHENQLSEGERLLRWRADEAMERYARGDDAALGDVYDAIKPRILGFLIRQTHSRPAAEDLLNDLFVRIMESRGGFVRDGAVLPWAYAIALNLARDFRRRHWHAINLAVEQEWAEFLHAPGALPDEALEQKRRKAAHDREVHRLPEKYRDAYILVRVQEVPVAEAAQALGISGGNAKVRALRAAERIAEALRDRQPPRGR